MRCHLRGGRLQPCFSAKQHLFLYFLRVEGVQDHASVAMSCHALIYAKLEFAASGFCGYKCAGGHLALHSTGDVTQGKGKHLLGTPVPWGLWGPRDRSKLWV